MKRRNIIILTIVLLCGFSTLLFSKYLLNDDKPTIAKMEVIGSNAKHYKIGDDINLKKSKLNIRSLESINSSDSIINTNLNKELLSVFTSYYSIYYGYNDHLNKESGIRLENNQMIINNTNQAHFNQLMIVDNYKNKINAVIDLNY